MEGGQSGASSPHPLTPARAAVDVVALTSRDDFLLELGALIGGQASVNPVESTAQALERLAASKRPTVLMIDSRDVADARADVEILQTQAPQASIVTFASEEGEEQLAATLRGTAVFAVLAMPMDQGKTSAVFEGAVADAKGKQATSRVPAPAPHTPALLPQPIALTPNATPAAANETLGEGGGRRGFPLQLAFGGIAALILIGGLIAYLAKDKAPAPAADTTPAATESLPTAEAALPAVETSLVKGKVDELLEKARLAMRERRYAEPNGDNALLYYRSAAATDPTSLEAQDGLNRVAGVLGGRFEEALEGGQLEEAATALAQFKNAIPEDPRVAQFQQRLTGSQVSKAMADGNLDRAAALLRAAQQGNLLPAPQLSRWKAEISRLQEEARQKRVADTAAREAAAAAEQKRAREARAAAAAEAERQAQAEREKQREEQAKAEQAAQAARESTAATNSAAPRAANAQSSLKRKRYIAPEYPQDALARKLGGVVTVTFTVDAKGETRDVHVEAADPAGVFDRAAITAVKRWRYEPPLVNGESAEVPVRMQIRFAPQD